MDALVPPSYIKPANERTSVLAGFLFDIKYFNYRASVVIVMTNGEIVHIRASLNN